MIVGQNSILNQYVPTFYIKDLRDGQTLIFDSVRRAFVNAEGSGTGGADRLGELLDVSNSVDDPLSLANGQVLTYNSTTNLWENKLIDINDLLPDQTGNAGKVLSTNGSTLEWVAQSTGTGTVTSVSVAGTTGRIISSGSPITSSGTITLDLATTGVAAGSYTNANVTVDAYGRITSVTNGSTSSGTVTSVAASGDQGVSVTGGPITTTGTFIIGLGNITPTSVAATGTVTGSNISGINTGDQTITLTGDVTGSGTGTFTTSLAATGVTAGVYGSSTQIPVITVDTKGRITNVTIETVSAGGTGTVTSVSVDGTAGRITSSGSPITSSGTITLDLATTGVSAGSYTNANVTVDAYGRITSVSNGTGGSGTVTSVSVTGNQGVTALVVNGTTTPDITIGLGNITPTSVAATGTVTGSNLSGTNTGDQTITLTGDVSGSGTGSFATTLATVNLTPGTYGDAHFVPTVTVNEKGLVTSVTTQHVDTSVRDLVIQDDVLVIAPRHQYIVTSVLEVEGYIINNGVIAIL